MLSERERRELAVIEQGLQSSDPRLSAIFSGRSPRALGRRLRYAKALVVVGVLLVVAGIMLSVDPALIDGLVLVIAGSWWWAWLRAPAAAAPPTGTRQADDS